MEGVTVIHHASIRLSRLDREGSSTTPLPRRSPNGYAGGWVAVAGVLPSPAGSGTVS
jgi:hypothetical protein